ncbi:gamma-glutamyltransferase 1 . Threonine peptidase. MEROPS family T03 [Gilliamella bombicola]|uniref:Glutathione hydrolase proenzyme n=1 Tax=Gilliamella bombicola TaxID=1798182 RepID=A0A1C4AT95_9GAMM|nr:gamma-glutamyltransferase [Gilliamella bombicola]SCB97789.1 gamma-glutamyltransferase 1 . Threonine peptidase. MEROPS family T03 [Gilliamella bombicola]
MFYLKRKLIKYCYFIVFLLISQQVLAVENVTQKLEAGAVASPDHYGAIAAQEILKKGGNAADAAVATAFALAVTYPEAGNIGGGGFMTLWMDGKPYFIDYREVAPSKADKDMYLDDHKNVIPNLSLYSYKASGVPGTVAGMWAVHQRFGKLSWKEVMAPAIRFANEGFTVDKQLVKRYQEAAELAPANGHFKQYFGAMQAEKVFKQPELGKVLERIANQGSDGFYKGETAKLIAQQMEKNDGLITENDLANYQAKWRAPLVANWQDMQIVTAPPPSSGGVGLIQLLLMKQDLANDFKDVKVNSPQYIHLLAEIEKRVFADRAEYMGDPDFISVPVTELIDTNYLAQRAKQVNPKAISITEQVKPGLDTNREKLQTTHFSIVDKWGNAASNTYTLNGWFGSAVVIEGTGIILNNEMDDFSSKPGVANQFGVVSKDANAIEPNKRPLSSMTPSIFIKNNDVAMVIGTPGGSRIFTSIFQVVTNVFDNHMSLKAAIDAPRYHHQLLPTNLIFIERFQNKVPEDLKDQLKQMGYQFKQQDFSGDIQAIKITDNKPEAVSDIRGRGKSIIVK